MSGFYFFFILLVVVGILVCVCWPLCLCTRRRRIAANAASEQRYTQFVDGNNNNSNAAAYPQGNGQDGLYTSLYYQQQQQQPPQVGVVHGPSADLHYPTGTPPQSGGHTSGSQPISATVLYAAPAGGPSENINFGQYFPEAQVAGGGANNTANGNTNYYCYNGSASAATGRATPHEASPYGEADYVSCPPPPQQPHTQRPSSGVSLQPPSPAQEGAASMPLPQYPVPSPLQPPTQILGNTVEGEDNAFTKGKGLD